MGTYTELYIAGYPVHTTKSVVDSTVMTIFRETDKLVEERSVSQRSELVWSKSIESDETELVIEYSATVKQVIDRLNIMGFNLDACKSRFKAEIEEKLKDRLEWLEEGDIGWIESEVELLKILTFNSYLLAISEIFKKKLVRWMSADELPDDSSPITKYIFSDPDCEMYYGFPVDDIRYFLRVFLEAAPKDELVVQDVTNLVHGEYYSKDDEICGDAVGRLIDDYLIDSKILILTEGSSDKVILEGSMNLLYPHLKDYYSFMDFGVSKAAGGAPALVSTIKAFIGAGIGNRVIALFDNDTAAKDALKALNSTDVPKTIKILHYPDIEIARSYPTLGPSGLTNVNINGLAASIEIYLGKDMLQVDDELTPIQWKGYNSSLNQYQGEILNKGEILKRFYKKLDACSKNKTPINESEWSELHSIFKKIFECFS